MLRLRLLAVVLPLCVLSLACSQLQRPTATFNKMSLGQVTTTGFTMNFNVDLHNPNTVDLPLQAADYTLALGGVRVLEGTATPSGALPASGSLPVTLPVSVTWENLLAAEKALRKGGGNIPYAFDGGVNFSGGSNFLGQPLRVPLKFEGTLPLRDLLNNPRVLLESEAARKLADMVLGSFFGK